MDNIDIIKYELQTLASYEPIDLENPEMEVAWEGDSGEEYMVTVCLVDMAKRVSVELKRLEDKVDSLQKGFDVLDNLLFLTRKNYNDLIASSSAREGIIKDIKGVLGL